MKITFDKNTLLEALTYTNEIVQDGDVYSFNTIIIETAGKDECFISGFNKKYQRVIKKKIKAEVHEEGECEVKAYRLFKTIESFPEEKIEFSHEESTTVISCSCFKAEIYTRQNFYEKCIIEHKLLPRKYIVFPVSPKILLDKLPDFLSSTNNSLDKVLFDFNEDGLFIVSLGNCQFSVGISKYTDKTDKQIVKKFYLPKKSFENLLMMIKDTEEDIIFKLYEHLIIFEIDKGNTVFSTQIFNVTKFFDYEVHLKGEYNTVINAEASRLISSLERFNSIIMNYHPENEDEENQDDEYDEYYEDDEDEIRSYVRVLVKDGFIELKTSFQRDEIKSLYEKINVEKTGQDIEFSVDCMFLAEALKACQCEKVSLMLKDTLSPILIEPQEGKNKDIFCFVVLPIKYKTEN